MLVDQAVADDRLADDDALGPRDAGQRAELRVAALDQLPEERRVQTRRRRAAGVARELARVAVERLALRVVVRRTRRRRTTAATLSLMK